MKTIPTSIPGFGCIYRPTYKDRHGVRQVSTVWWAKFKTDSKPVRRNLKTQHQQEAYEQLLVIAGKRVTGELRDARPETVTIGELLDLLLGHYRSKKTYADVECRVRLHLRPQFGDMKVRDLRRADVEAFVTKLKGQNAENSTVNRYLSNLHKALELGRDHELVNVIPKFPWQDERGNVRQGIVDAEVYKAMRDELSRTAPHAALALVIAYYTGMRRGEITSLQWEQIDIKGRMIRLKSAQTKNRHARTAPIYGEMAAFLEMASTKRAQDWPTCPWVIAWHGKRVQSLKTAWGRAAEEIGVNDALFHDLRRTALTNMEEAGIPRSVAMAISGHRTESAYKRYLIGSERRVVAAGVTMEKYFQSKQQAPEDANASESGTRQNDFGTRQRQTSHLKN